MTVDWSTEWLSSLTWVVAVTIAAAVVSAVLVAVLTRTTVWGRQFRRLAYPYFSRRSERGWRPLLTVLGVLALTIAGVRVQVVNSYNVNGLYTALSQGDAPGFWLSVVIFAILSVVALVQVLLAFYLQQRLTLRWRAWLNDHMLGDWLAGGAYHRNRYTDAPVDNPDQRLQEDVGTFTAASVTLAVGTIGSLVSLVSFTLILWELSGPLPLFGVEIPRAMTFIAYLYVIVATVIAFRIGRPLIRLNFLNQALTASYRYALVRVRDNAEAIALTRGEPAERGVLDGRFAAVLDNAWAIVFRTLKFQGFNVVITQYSQIIPLVIQAPRLFAQQITLGDIQQTAAVFSQLQDALSFFRLAYDDFASYRAMLVRLTGLLDTDAAARALPSARIGDDPDVRGLAVRDLTVRLPDERVLVDDLSLAVEPGDALLLTGPSGSGKTTLLRSIAGLWPHAEGAVERPVDAGTVFLSQRPHLPLGSLRAGLAYPAAPDTLDDDRAAEVLRQVQLAHLVDELDADVEWGARLSAGEQQRLGLARVLLGRPRLVFLDEATSALDEGLEHALYTLLRAELPDTVLVSVAHRDTAREFHPRRLELLGEGRWQVSPGTP